MNFLFWNINGREIPHLIAQLAEQSGIDVLALAENPIPIASLLTAVNQSTATGTFISEFNPSNRITLLSRLPVNSIRPLADSGAVSFRHLIPPTGQDIVLVVAHLPSKLHRSDIHQAFNSIRIARAIEECETKVGHARTIVVGDLNMNPFEDGLCGADAFHAVMSRRIAERGSRRVDNEERRFFYNPMWSRFGDRSDGPPGTFYYPQGGQVCYFWNMFDQVLVRPALLPYFSDCDVRVITKIGNVNLLTDLQHPDTAIGSDHLPLAFTLNL